LPDNALSVATFVPARVGTFRSAGDAAGSVLRQVMHQRFERMRARQEATEYLAAAVATHAFVITIASGAPKDGFLCQGLRPQIFFAPESLPKLQAHFELRRLAGSPCVGGMSDWICVGLVS
jgi:hypothetical protein